MVGTQGCKNTDGQKIAKYKKGPHFRKKRGLSGFLRVFLGVFLVAQPVVGLRAETDIVFLDGFTDVPLLAGFQIETEGRLLFDTPSGTVAALDLSYETGLLSLRQAFAQYQAALTNLGWRCEGQNAEGERLLFCERADLSLRLDFVGAGHKGSKERGLVHVRGEPSKKKPDF